jgi:hypothetical protein
MRKPDPKLIDSMALRYRHDFGLLDEKEKNSIRTQMTQLWEEVVGIGFYNGCDQQGLKEAFEAGRKQMYDPFNEDQWDWYYDNFEDWIKKIIKHGTET